MSVQQQQYWTILGGLEQWMIMVQRAIRELEIATLTLQHSSKTSAVDPP
jgi:hypothetical protein